MYPSFQSRIPNGDSIPHPCDATLLWAGVGHWNPRGSGERNPFGRDFETNGKVRFVLMV